MAVPGPAPRCPTALVATVDRSPAGRRLGRPGRGRPSRSRAPRRCSPSERSGRSRRHERHEEGPASRSPPPSLVAAACSGGDDSAGDDDEPGTSGGDGPDDVDTGDCIVVDMAVSSEKIALLEDLADEFNDVRRGRGQRALHRRAAAQRGLRARRHADPGGLAEPRRQRRAARHLVAGRVGVGRHRQRPRRAGARARRDAVHADAARHRHAPADGRGARLAGRSRSASPTSSRCAKNPEGWGAVGHPEWGPFRLGKTNPNFSTSGLNFTIAEYYAAVGKTQGLTIEDLARPAAVEFASQIESSVVHYGDITMTFLNNWFAADARGTALTYASVVAVEEKSVIDYNLGNPDGVLSPGEEPRVPRDPLVAIYPEEGTLFSDSPFIVLDTEWVDDEEKAAAAAFETFVQLPGEPADGARVRLPAEQRGGAARRPDRRRERRRPGPADGRAGGPVARRARRHPRLVGRAAQGRPRAARARHLRLDGRAGRRRRRQDPPRPRPGGGDQRPRPVQGRPTTSGCGRSAPISAAPTRTSASSCRSARSATSARPIATAIADQFPTNGTPLYDVTETGVRDDGRRATTRRGSTPSCC